MKKAGAGCGCPLRYLSIVSLSPNFLTYRYSDQFHKSLNIKVFTLLTFQIQSMIINRAVLALALAGGSGMAAAADYCDGNYDDSSAPCQLPADINPAGEANSCTELPVS